MHPELLMRLAYGANILILTPVVTLLLTGPAARIFGSGTTEVASLKLLIASLWAGILLCSLAGLFQPRAMLGILVLQVLYKTIWLVLFVWPAWRSGAPVPWGPAITFIPIILLWPWIIFAATR